MWFKVDYHSPKPVYQQIKDRIKEQILNKNLQEGDSLPSIRVLAKNIKVNLNTVQRAYRELEFEGYIEARKGVGFTVTSSKTNEIEKEIIDEFKKNVKRLHRAGIKKSIILDLINDIIEN